MSDITNINLSYDRPIKIAEEVYWVGSYDAKSAAHSNPYLIVDHDEAVVIDGGSRSDFPTVMMKIMQTGINLSSIVALVYQNYDPRTCGSIPHLEGIIDRRDLKIISDLANHMFIQHYSESAMLLALEDISFHLKFSSGRRLNFVKTPYAHSAGSFVTFDEKTGILFTSDLFSSYASDWKLLLNLSPRCKNCKQHEQATCPDQKEICQLHEILKFHQDIMTSERALKCALERIAQVPFSLIAPQRGGIIHDPEDIILISEALASLKGVGIDSFVGDRSFFDLGDTSPIKERLRKK